MQTLQRIVSMLIGAVIIAYLLTNVRNQSECIKEDFQSYWREYFRASLELTPAEEEEGLARL